MDFWGFGVKQWSGQNENSRTLNKWKRDRVKSSREYSLLGYSQGMNWKYKKNNNTEDDIKAKSLELVLVSGSGILDFWCFSERGKFEVCPKEINTIQMGPNSWQLMNNRNCSNTRQIICLWKGFNSWRVNELII